MEVCLRQTLPVIEHYAARGVLQRVDGDQPIEAVRAQLRAAAESVSLPSQSSPSFVAA